jgi:hypothetical protein
MPCRGSEAMSYARVVLLYPVNGTAPRTFLSSTIPCCQ